MNEQAKSKYWLDLAAADISAHYSEGEIIVSSGISPSASYHVGHFREILTADALTWAIKQLGRQVKHIHVVDNFDPLRKRYDFLPERFEQFVGQPICLIPDPFDECEALHKTYAEHFYQEFEKYAKQMGIFPDVVIRSYEDLYASGRMTQRIEQVLEHNDVVRQIFEQTSGRELPEDWTPVQIMNDKQMFHNARIAEWVKADKIISGVSYTDGHAKLNWRLDWPARWAELGVMVEPFSAQEHGAAGGSYDTGVEFSSKVFGSTAPIPGVRYGNIHMIGDTKKMSSSKGNLVTPAQALEIMPAEILRYFVVRSMPERTLYFDPGVGVYKLIDEFVGVQEAQIKGLSHEFAEAFKFATAGKSDKVIASVPFNHLVAVYQAARGDESEIMNMLARTGFETAVKNESDVLRRELVFVANWLKKYAPESVKFNVQDTLPKVELSDQQRTFLTDLAAKLEAAGELDGPAMHEQIYAAKEAAGLKPAEAFQALYRVILSKDSGPKAGWFLASLDRAWLTRRLKLED